jgi:hypothetical protein
MAVLLFNGYHCKVCRPAYLLYSVNDCTNGKSVYHNPFLKPTRNIKERLENGGDTSPKEKTQKQLTTLLQVQEEVEVQNAQEVTEALEELEKQGKHLEIQICPRCKSPRVRKAKSTGGDMWGHLGMVPPSYECPDCGWQERIVIKATNKPLTVREVEIIREFMDEEEAAK